MTRIRIRHSNCVQRCCAFAAADVPFVASLCASSHGRHCQCRHVVLAVFFSCSPSLFVKVRGQCVLHILARLSPARGQMFERAAAAVASLLSVCVSTHEPPNSTNVRPLFSLPLFSPSLSPTLFPFSRSECGLAAPLAGQPTLPPAPAVRCCLSSIIYIAAEARL